MGDKPILFNAEMVRAILSKRKTQTRRMKGLSAISDSFVQHGPAYFNPTKDAWIVPGANCWSNAEYDEVIGLCPYGQVGDRLWVRETWSAPQIADKRPPLDLPRDAPVYYHATSAWSRKTFNDIGKKRPSIFMPRWASRILLKITKVRVERVQDITEDDAMAEGIVFVDHGLNQYGQQKNGWAVQERAESGDCLGTARFAFGNLWDSINAKRGYGWDADPWVWALDFELAGQ